jgi:uncharacterized protein YrzB (UPF0473 family)
MEERKEIITLVDEDGARLEFLVLDYFDVEEIDYAILMPFDQGRTDGESELLLDDEDAAMIEEMDAEGELDEDGYSPEEVNGDAVIFRVEKGVDGETMLQVIEDDEEWEKVAEIAYERLFTAENDLQDEDEGL